LHEYSDDEEDDFEGATRKLKSISKIIKKGGLTRKELRLLQNRKSALKCRIKKEQETYRVKKQLHALQAENEDLQN
jgi:5-bromo-4-chloroindolyl phosphate hydrolysis protein